MRTAILLAFAIAAYPLIRLDIRFSKATWPESKKARPIFAVIASFFFVALALFCARQVYFAIQIWQVDCIGQGCVGQYNSEVEPFKYWGTVLLWYAAFVISLSTIANLIRVHFGKRSEP